MALRVICFFWVILFCFPCFGQDQEKYFSLVKEAKELSASKKYLEASFKYNEAFKANGYKGTTTDRYNAACVWALAGRPDSAFTQLFKIATRVNYSNYDHLIADEDFISLYNDKRWDEVVALVKTNKETAEAKLNKPLMKELEVIHNEDQSYRRKIESTQKEYGKDSKEMKDLWKTIIEKDSLNLIKVLAILDKYGWLGPDVVGGMGNSTLFLVIQHSDIKTQEKYLPMMREAVKNKNAFAGDLALLEDRIALRQGKKQIYGSQIGMDPKTGAYYVLPLEDPDNVDKRRAEVGLQPLAEYVSHWGMKWDVEQYKKDLPELEKKSKH
jgi:hypothetical protein